MDELRKIKNNINKEYSEKSVVAGMLIDTTSELDEIKEKLSKLIDKLVDVSDILIRITKECQIDNPELTKRLEDIICDIRELRCELSGR